MTYLPQKIFLLLLLVVVVMVVFGSSEAAVGHVVLGVIGLFFICYAFGTSLLSVLWAGLSGVVRGAVVVLVWVFTRKRASAKFMTWWESLFFFTSGNQGWLVDGHSKRLTEKVSMQSVIAQGGVGTGKSTIFALPNLYTLTAKSSVIILDVSGEIFQQSSGYLSERGFQIKVLNFMDMDAGETYNPLATASSYTEIGQVANLIMRSSPTGDDDPFWTSGSEKLIRLMCTCLRNRGNPEHLNLANVYHLLNHFDAHLGDGSALDRFVAQSTVNDESTYSEWRGVLNQNSRTTASFLAGAATALSQLGNPQLARMTCTSSFSFKDIQRTPTAFYILVRQQDIAYFSFTINLWFTQLFGSLLSELNPKNLPTYLLLDEFGQLTLPSFPVFAATARKYSVSVFGFLQSQAQLESRYNALGAKTILDSFATSLYLPGMGLDTAKALERRLGKIRIEIEQGGQTTCREENLLNEAEIIQMPSNEALLIYSNRRPVKLRTKPFYKLSDMLRKSKIPPYPMRREERGEVPLVSLDREQTSSEQGELNEPTVPPTSN